ncbi:MAG: APC family permease, partial [Candidatus Geothermarchaeota archaeon]
WQLTNATYIAAIFAVGYYAAYGVYPSAYSYFAVGSLALIVPVLASIFDVKKASSFVTYATVIRLALNIIALGLLIAYAHYFSVDQFNPNFAPGGIHGALFSLVVFGFFSYAGYGFLLFYTEEGKRPYKNTWKAAIIALVIATILSVVVSYFINAVFGPIAILKAIEFPQPGLLLYVRYLGRIGELAIVGILIILVVFSFSSGVGAQGRIMYALVRDGFIKTKWVGKLNKHDVPMNNIILNFIIALASFLIMGAIFIPIYGYFNSIFYLSYVPSAISTVFWYFHHIIPDLSLASFFKKHKIKLTNPRNFIISIIIPIVSAGFIIYSMYESIITYAVEPYFAGVVLSGIIILGILVWVMYRYYTGTIGISSVELQLNEDAINKLGGVIITPGLGVKNE